MMATSDEFNESIHAMALDHSEHQELQEKFEKFHRKIKCGKGKFLEKSRLFALFPFVIIINRNHQSFGNFKKF